MERQELLREIEEEFGTGCAAICKERARQKEVKGYDIERDSYLYENEELVDAATSYVLRDNEWSRIQWWPWDVQSWKPTPNNRKREFEKAGALLAAQIDVENYKSKI